MNAPAGMYGVLSRISSLGQGPSGMAEIRSRFGVSLRAAVQPTQPTGAGEVTQNRAGAGVKNEGTGSVTVDPTNPASISSTGTVTPASAAATETTTPAAAVPAATGDWTTRLPAAGNVWANQISATAKQYGLEPEFLSAVIWTESSFNPTAVSPDGAVGLGQLMPATAAWLEVDPWNPAQNIDGAARYYRNLIDRFGSLELAVASYFSGPGAVSRAGGIPTDRSQAYVDKVLGRRAYLLGTAATAP